VVTNLKAGIQIGNHNMSGHKRRSFSISTKWMTRWQTKARLPNIRPNTDFGILVAPIRPARLSWTLTIMLPTELPYSAPECYQPLDLPESVNTEYSLFRVWRTSCLYRHSHSSVHCKDHNLMWTFSSECRHNQPNRSQIRGLPISLTCVLRVWLIGPWFLFTANLRNRHQNMH